MSLGIIPNDMDEHAREYLGRIEDMLDDLDYSWAADTLEGIKETIQRTGTVSVGQARAIDNIEAAVESRR